MQRLAFLTPLPGRHLKRKRGETLRVGEQRRFHDLFHQQLWCWGRDIWATGGNLLIRHGMTRHPCESNDPPGSHRYGITLANGARIDLWGFGAVVGSGSKALFLQRCQSQERLLQPGSSLSSVWRPEQLLTVSHRPESAREKTDSARLFYRFCRWVEAYEHWVTREMGSAYRDQVLSAWEQTVLSGPAMPGGWHGIAAIVRRRQAVFS